MRYRVSLGAQLEPNVLLLRLLGVDGRPVVTVTFPHEVQPWQPVSYPAYLISDDGPSEHMSGERIELP